MTVEESKLQEITEKAKSIPNSAGVIPQTKEEKRSRGRRPDTPEQRAAKQAAKAAGSSGKSFLAGTAQNAGPKPPAVINEQRVQQTAKILELPVKMIESGCVSWTGSSKAAMKPGKKEGICHAWAMIIELYFPDFMNDPKILALITVAVVSGEYGMQVYAIKKLIALGELEPDQAASPVKTGSPGPVSTENIASPVTPMQPEPSPFPN